MAVLNILTNFLYGVVQETWITAAITVKYLLLANLGVLAYRKELGVEKFGANILEYGKPILLSFAVAGTTLHVSGLEITPFFVFPSYLIAMLTLGFLFWKY